MPIPELELDSVFSFIRKELHLTAYERSVWAKNVTKVYMIQLILETIVFVVIVFFSMMNSYK